MTAESAVIRMKWFSGRLRILRDYTPDPIRQNRDDIVRPPWRHGELGRNDRALDREVVVTITNGPKVKPGPKPGTAPRGSNSAVRSWPYAGTSVNPALRGFGLRIHVKMRPVRTISRKGWSELLSDQNPQRPNASHPRSEDEVMVRAIWRHMENLERNSLSGKFRPARMV